MVERELAHVEKWAMCGLSDSGGQPLPTSIQNMCNYCNPDSDKCCIWKDSLTNDPYLDIETYKWDEYNDGFVHQREYISYCPYCGRKLDIKGE